MIISNRTIYKNYHVSEKRNKLFFLFSFLFLVVLSVFFIMEDQETKTLESKSGVIGPSLVIICFLYSFWGLHSYKKKYSSIVIIFFSLFYIWINLVNILTIQANSLILLYRLGFYSVPIITMILCYSYTKNRGLEKKVLNFIVLCFFVLVIQYLRIRFLSGGHSFLFDGEGKLLCVNYPLFLLPLLLLYPNRKFLVFIVVIIVFVSFSSGKRSTIVALLISLFLFGLCESFIEKNEKSSMFKVVFIGSIIMISLYYLFLYMDTLNYGLLSERFINISDDGGSGRDFVWLETIKMIENQNLINTLFGSGYNGVVNNSIYQLSAHNDFLEVRYDYGLIGVSLFIISLLAVIRKSYFYIRKKNKYAPNLICIIALFITLSMISHVVYLYIMVMASISLGLLLGAAEYEKRKKNIQ